MASNQDDMKLMEKLFKFNQTREEKVLDENSKKNEGKNTEGSILIRNQDAANKNSETVDGVNQYQINRNYLPDCSKIGATDTINAQNPLLECFSTNVPENSSSLQTSQINATHNAINKYDTMKEGEQKSDILKYVMGGEEQTISIHNLIKQEKLDKISQNNRAEQFEKYQLQRELDYKIKSQQIMSQLSGNTAFISDKKEKGKKKNTPKSSNKTKQSKIMAKDKLPREKGNSYVQWGQQDLEVPYNTNFQRKNINYLMNESMNQSNNAPSERTRRGLKFVEFPCKSDMNTNKMAFPLPTIVIQNEPITKPSQFYESGINTNDSATHQQYELGNNPNNYTNNQLQGLEMNTNYSSNNQLCEFRMNTNDYDNNQLCELGMNKNDYDNNQLCEFGTNKNHYDNIQLCEMGMNTNDYADNQHCELGINTNYYANNQPCELGINTNYYANNQPCELGINTNYYANNQLYGPGINSNFCTTNQLYESENNTNHEIANQLSELGTNTNYNTNNQLYGSGINTNNWDNNQIHELNINANHRATHQFYESDINTNNGAIYNQSTNLGKITNFTITSEESKARIINKMSSTRNQEMGIFQTGSSQRTQEHISTINDLRHTKKIMLQTNQTANVKISRYNDNNNHTNIHRTAKSELFCSQTTVHKYQQKSTVERIDHGLRNDSPHLPGIDNQGIHRNQTIQPTNESALMTEESRNTVHLKTQFQNHIFQSNEGCNTTVIKQSSHNFLSERKSLNIATESSVTHQSPNSSGSTKEHKIYEEIKAKADIICYKEGNTFHCEIALDLIKIGVKNKINQPRIDDFMSTTNNQKYNDMNVLNQQTSQFSARKMNESNTTDSPDQINHYMKMAVNNYNENLTQQNYRNIGNPDYMINNFSDEFQYMDGSNQDHSNDLMEMCYMSQPEIYEQGGSLNMPSFQTNFNIQSNNSNQNLNWNLNETGFNNQHGNDPIYQNNINSFFSDQSSYMDDI